MTTRNKFKYTKILAMVLNGDSREDIIAELERIGNFHSNLIIDAIEDGNHEKAMSLIRCSSKFEMNMNKDEIDKTTIIITDEGVKARIENLIIINGLSREQATIIATNRQRRLKNTIVATFSHSSGYAYISAGE